MWKFWPLSISYKEKMLEPSRSSYTSEVAFFGEHLTHKHGLFWKLRDINNFHCFCIKCRRFLLELAWHNREKTSRKVVITTQSWMVPLTVSIHIQLCQHKDQNTCLRCESTSHVFLGSAAMTVTRTVLELLQASSYCRGQNGQLLVSSLA